MQNRPQPYQRSASRDSARSRRPRSRSNISTRATFIGTRESSCWRTQTILDALTKAQPEMIAHLRTIADAYGTAEFDAVFAREFATIRGISIDYAVMEQADNVVLIEAPFDWDDLGSWQALARQRGQDAEGNTIAARHLGIKTSGTIVFNDERAKDHLIVTVGTEDLIIVHTPDATLVAPRSHEESLRQVVKELEKRGWRQNYNRRMSTGYRHPWERVFPCMSNSSPTNAVPGRVSAIDYGTVRIGIAISDARRTIASPLENYTRRSRQADGDIFVAWRLRRILYCSWLACRSTWTGGKARNRARRATSASGLAK